MDLMISDTLSEPSPARPSVGSRPPPSRPTGWNRFSWPQLVVMGLATVAPVVIVGAVAGAVLGVIGTEDMIDVALAAGENPGMITFGAMFLASPVQWLTGRSQIRVRKYLGIVFYLLALSNGVMFVIEEQLGDMLSEPLLVAGTAALALAAPLFVTSNRFSQRLIGMRNWRLLHRLTYVVAVALLAHVILVGDLGLGSVLITLGFVARIPPVRRLLEARSGRAGHHDRFGSSADRSPGSPDPHRGSTVGA